jgi:hypothetical protein
MAATSAATTMDWKLEIKKIEGINEVQPAVFEIVVSLQNGSRTILRMDAYALQALANPVGGHPFTFQRDPNKSHGKGQRREPRGARNELS